MQQVRLLCVLGLVTLLSAMTAGSITQSAQQAAMVVPPPVIRWLPPTVRDGAAGGSPAGAQTHVRTPVEPTMTATAHAELPSSAAHAAATFTPVHDDHAQQQEPAMPSAAEDLTSTATPAAEPTATPDTAAIAEDAAPAPRTAAAIANAEAVLRNGQPGMSQARIQWSKNALARAERDLRTAEGALTHTTDSSVSADQVAVAEAELHAAETDLERSTVPQISAEQRAAAEAELRDAQAALDMAQETALSAGDLAQAEQALRDAQARLQRLESGPDPSVVLAAQERAGAARQNLETVATRSSAAKIEAERSMLQAAETVRSLQEAYSQSYWQAQQASSGVDPATGTSFDTAGLDATIQQQHYTDALAVAESRLNEAQARFDGAQAAYAQTRQQEIDDVQAAQAQADQAQAELQTLIQKPTPDILVNIHDREESRTAPAPRKGIMPLPTLGGD